MDLLSRFHQEPLPFSKLLGIELRSVAPDRIVAEMTVREDLCTRPAVLHGGAIMAFADTLGALGTVANLTTQTAARTAVPPPGRSQSKARRTSLALPLSVRVSPAKPRPCISAGVLWSGKHELPLRTESSSRSQHKRNSSFRLRSSTILRAKVDAAAVRTFV